MCFWGWIWFGRKCPSANFPKVPRCETARLQAGQLLGRNLRTSMTTNELYVFRLEFVRWDLKTDPSWCQLGGGCGIKGDTSAEAKAPLSAVCTVCTEDSKTSTGTWLVTLPEPRRV